MLIYKQKACGIFDYLCLRDPREVSDIFEIYYQFLRDLRAMGVPLNDMNVLGLCVIRPVICVGI